MAKTVRARLRSIHSSDKDLLESLNLYSGYLISRGYQEKSIKFHLASMANRDRMAMLKGEYKPKLKLTVPLVTNLHPAITCLSNILPASFNPICKADPLLDILLPPSSLMVAYRKLPNLMKLLCSPDQNKYLSPPLPINNSGYMDTGCKCMVCKASNFGRFARSPSMPGYRVPLPGTVTCGSGPAIVYHLVCMSGRPECRRAHYIGMASSARPNDKPMSKRWANHKSHHKTGRNNCHMTDHLITCHKNENTQDFVKITILEACQDAATARERETIWTFKLFGFYPAGLNKREEVVLE